MQNDHVMQNATGMPLYMATDHTISAPIVPTKLRAYDIARKSTLNPIKPPRKHGKQPLKLYKRLDLLTPPQLTPPHSALPSTTTIPSLPPYTGSKCSPSLPFHNASVGLSFILIYNVAYNVKNDILHSILIISAPCFIFPLS